MGIALLFIYMIFVPNRKHTYVSPRPDTGLILPFYMQMTFVPHRKHAYAHLWPVTGIALFVICR
jgi:hypothetical protein